MKEPLLAAVVANEPKTSVTNESLNRTARPPSLLGHTCPRGREYQISFQPDIRMYGRDFTQSPISSSDNRREYVLDVQNPTVWQRVIPRLWLDIDSDRLAQIVAGFVEVVAQLQSQLVLSRRKLHVDLGAARSEVHPRGRALDDCHSWRQAILIDADVMMSHPRPSRLDRAFRDRRELIVLDAKLEVNGTLHRRTVLRFDEEHARLGSSGSRR